MARRGSQIGANEPIRSRLMCCHLRKCLLRSRTGRGYAGAQTVADALGHLPLALDHAAAYCKPILKGKRSITADGGHPCRGGNRQSHREILATAK